MELPKAVFHREDERPPIEMNPAVSSYLNYVENGTIIEKCPECGSEPILCVAMDRSHLSAVSLKCSCGEIEMAIPFGVELSRIIECWNEAVEGKCK